MTTTASLIEDTKRILFTGRPDQQNKLAADVTAGATLLTFQFPLEGIQEGASVQVGLELFYVWSVSPGAQTAVVQPAQQGSSAADHDSGDLVTVNPRYSDYAILRALNDDLLDLSSPMNGLYQQKQVDLTWVDAEGGYDLTGVTSLEDISDLWIQRGGVTSRDWQKVTNFELARNVDTTLFPSGFALFITDQADAGSSLRVQYRAPFGQLATLTDDVQTVTGLPRTANDIPPLGAAARLTRSAEIRRNDPSSQGDSRRANEVPSGAIRRSGDQLWGDRQRRVMAEVARLGQANPLMSYIPPRTRYTVSTLSSSRY